MRALGVNTWVWTSPLTDQELERIAPRVAGWGFDLLELPVENTGDWDPRRARTLLDGLGLDAGVVLVMGPGRELVATDPATRSATQDYLRRVVDAAATVGSTVVAGPAYASVGRTWRMSPSERAGLRAELTEALAPVVEHAAAAGVRVAVEPLNRYETSVLNTVDQALEALADLPAQHCGLALDLYHMNIEERDVADAVRRAGENIHHVQVCANDRGAPGADHLDWSRIVTALDQTGYSGPLVIESFTADNASIATAASVWRPLAASQDAIAVDGLAHLRSLPPTAGAVVH
ncbi:tagatose 3-epimerase [Nocardiopsis terrae]|uniref:D-psicose/D-tagatose/L-ribulose 3-epimerase n=1 Tax=Nocardiopsis terrae TaxID=372655 RepID=A0ABR9HBD4_9ACTN|nr:sugar phosphate isomerase/epimerase [Nocardiopsis terrae]MBE1456334.1 D-psicose/D-tagatose/L-ribulose 3-epimerase [Nocardiopsis terrae]GHC77435.1 tagatose 3-epimerase [Nocardiopsis terrae]